MRHPHVVKALVELGIQPSQAYLTIEAIALRLQKTPESLVDELTRAAAIAS